MAFHDDETTARAEFGERPADTAARHEDDLEDEQREKARHSLQGHHDPATEEDTASGGPAD